MSLSTPEFECTCLQWQTRFPEKGTSEALKRWASLGSSADVRRVDTVHDVVSVLRQTTFCISSMSDLTNALRQVTDDKWLVPGRQFGKTIVTVVKSKHRAALTEVGIEVHWPDLVGPVCSGELIPGVTVFVGLSSDHLLITADPDDDTDSRLGALLYGPFAIAEIMRHKIQGQFGEYEDRFRDDLQDSVKQLTDRLKSLHEDLEASRQSQQRNVARSLKITEDVFRSYSKAIRSFGPVRQILAMLEVNQKNLQTAAQHLAGDTPGASLLERRYSQANQLCIQVAADLNLLEPLLKSAEWLGHVQQGHMLATLGVNESVENELRSQQQRMDQYRSLLLTLLGIWIGLGGMWATMVTSIKDKRDLSDFLSPFFYVFGVPVIGLLLILCVAWKRKPR